ncbi:NADH-quinone oxidoreductase subunit NuoE [Thalassotalea sp. ND16A]|uniref:NADH-quinone oxidoreductase subunit NuoE n=1 Tax=Thalassotalea sp. ND16A TaxID=1535422 RepID=UPI00051CDD8B|nr:NADH-quinone oxidoreductase subunit NuoE [Thalassotalea sp. ND16A]KGJ97172.1 NADH dehydrogenase (quinone) [Thalassotalea sp. ND16A]
METENMTLLSFKQATAKHTASNGSAELIEVQQVDYKSHLTKAEIAEIEHETTILEYREAAGIEALKIVQKNRGWISDDSLYAIADFLQMGVAQLEGVATFYNLIYRQPVGKYVIHVCNSISCYLTGYDNISDILKAELAIDYGQTSSDGLFTLLTNACLGGCDKGPVLMVAEQHYYNLDVDKIKQLLQQLRSKAEPSANTVPSATKEPSATTVASTNSKAVSGDENE